MGERIVCDLEVRVDGTEIPIRDIFTIGGDKISALDIILLDFRTSPDGGVGGGGGSDAGGGGVDGAGGGSRVDPGGAV